VFFGLDTTHPGVQRFLRDLIHRVVHEFGYEYLKLDFTYGAALRGQVHDPTLSPAERIALGHRIIRDAAGEGVFILACGCPLSPVRGLVDAMRIGPDVAPYWFAKYRYHLTRDPHALCTRFAIRSILNRCQTHRKLWINDPDCLLLRDGSTKLTVEERMSLAHAVIITGGMLMVSDRLSQYAPDTWEQLERIEQLVRDCDQGRAWPLDYMERASPELVHNSRGYLAVFNFEDRAVRKRIPIGKYLPGSASDGDHYMDVWSGEIFRVSEGLLDLGTVGRHASRLLQVVRG
jgi:alpha-galactosidase